MLKPSIVIPSYNREEVLLRFLPAISAEAVACNAEIIVVDQTGYDGSRLSQAAGGTDVKHIRAKRPNLPAARNAGAVTASGDILVFIDDDAAPEPGWLRTHLEAYGNPAIGAVAGGVIDANAKGLSAIPVEYDPVSGRYYTDFGCTIKQETVSVPGVNFSVRRSVWEAIRFDESYTGNAYFEEVDFAFRLRQAGWKVIYEPTAKVGHDLIRAGGCRQTGMAESYYRFRNYALFYFRFSKVRHCPVFFKREKNYLEYVSRGPTHDHRTSIVLAAAAGLVVGAARGLAKRIRSKTGRRKTGQLRFARRSKEQN